jgi:hypothetical protein
VRTPSIVLVIITVATAVSRAATPEWPQFRGPGGLGVADASSLPERWSGTSNVAWLQPRFAGYTPSPLAYRGRIYSINDNGILQVADAKTGVEIFKARIGGGGHTFSSSPLASQGGSTPAGKSRAVHQRL